MSSLLSLILYVAILHCHVLCFWHQNEDNTLTNYNKRYAINITSYYTPTTENDIIDIILNQTDISNNSVIRVIGNSYSFSANGMAEEYNFYRNTKQNVIMLNLSVNMNNIIDIDSENMTATFQGGSNVYDILSILQQQNLALPYYGGM